MSHDYKIIKQQSISSAWRTFIGHRESDTTFNFLGYVIQSIIPESAYETIYENSTTETTLDENTDVLLYGLIRRYIKSVIGITIHVFQDRIMAALDIDGSGISTALKIDRATSWMPTSISMLEVVYILAHQGGKILLPRLQSPLNEDAYVMKLQSHLEDRVDMFSEGHTTKKTLNGFSPFDGSDVIGEDPILPKVVKAFGKIGWHIIGGAAQVGKTTRVLSALRRFLHERKHARDFPSVLPPAPEVRDKTEPESILDLLTESVAKVETGTSHVDAIYTDLRSSNAASEVIASLASQLALSGHTVTEAEMHLQKFLNKLVAGSVIVFDHVGSAQCCTVLTQLFDGFINKLCMVIVQSGDEKTRPEEAHRDPQKSRISDRLYAFESHAKTSVHLKTASDGTEVQDSDLDRSKGHGRGSLLSQLTRRLGGEARLNPELEYFGLLVMKPLAPSETRLWATRLMHPVLQPPTNVSETRGANDDPALGDVDVAFAIKLVDIASRIVASAGNDPMVVLALSRAPKKTIDQLLAMLPSATSDQVNGVSGGKGVGDGFEGKPLSLDDIFMHPANIGADRGCFILIGCLSPLVVMRGSCFDADLAWALSEEAFIAEVGIAFKQNASKQFQQSWSRLLRHGWLEKQLSGYGNEESVYVGPAAYWAVQLSQAALLCLARGSNDPVAHRDCLRTQWVKYFSYWAVEAKRLNSLLSLKGLSRYPVSIGHVRPDLFHSKLSASVRDWNVTYKERSLRIIIDELDRKMHHIYRLLHPWMKQLHPETDLDDSDESDFPRQYFPRTQGKNSNLFGSIDEVIIAVPKTLAKKGRTETELLPRAPNVQLNASTETSTSSQISMSRKVTPLQHPPPDDYHDDADLVERNSSSLPLSSSLAQLSPDDRGVKNRRERMLHYISCAEFPSPVRPLCSQYQRLSPLTKTRGKGPVYRHYSNDDSALAQSSSIAMHAAFIVLLDEGTKKYMQTVTSVHPKMRSFRGLESDACDLILLLRLPFFRIVEILSSLVETLQTQLEVWSTTAVTQKEELLGTDPVATALSWCIVKAQVALAELTLSMKTSHVSDETVKILRSSVALAEELLSHESVAAASYHEHLFVNLGANVALARSLHRRSSARQVAADGAVLTNVLNEATKLTNEAEQMLADVSNRLSLTLSVLSASFSSSSLAVATASLSACLHEIMAAATLEDVSALSLPLKEAVRRSLLSGSEEEIQLTQMLPQLLVVQADVFAASLVSAKNATLKFPNKASSALTLVDDFTAQGEYLDSPKDSSMGKITGGGYFPPRTVSPFASNEGFNRGEGDDVGKSLRMRRAANTAARSYHSEDSNGDYNTPGYPTMERNRTIRRRMVDSIADKALKYYTSAKLLYDEMYTTVVSVARFDRSTRNDGEQDCTDDRDEKYEDQEYDNLKLATAGMSVTGGEIGIKIAKLLMGMGDADSALRWYQESIAVFKTKTVGSHPRLCEALVGISDAFLSQGRFESLSRRLLEEALVLYRSLYLDEHPTVLYVASLLASALSLERRFDVSMKVYDNALMTVRSLARDATTPEARIAELAAVPPILIRKAILCSQMEEPGRAVSFYREAVTIYREVFGYYHTSVADTLCLLAEAVRSLGDGTQKQQQQRPQQCSLTQAWTANLLQHLSPSSAADASAGYRPRAFNWTLGRGHIHTGFDIRPSSRYMDAKKLLEEALEIYSDMDLARSPACVKVWQQLAILHYENGKTALAKQCFEVILDMYMEVGVGVTEELADLYVFFGTVLLATESLSEATIMFEQASDIYRQMFGDIHPKIAHVCYFQGTAFFTLKEFESAQSFFEHAKDIFSELYDDGGEEPTSVEVGDCLHNIGFIMQSLREHEDAVVAYKAAIIIFTSSHGPLHISVANVAHNIATAYDDLDETSLALRYYRLSCGILRELYGENHPQVAETLAHIAALLEQLGDRSESAARAQMISHRILTRLENEENSVFEAHEAQLAAPAAVSRSELSLPRGASELGGGIIEDDLDELFFDIFGNDRRNAEDVGKFSAAPSQVDDYTHDHSIFKRAPSFVALDVSSFSIPNRGLSGKVVHRNSSGDNDMSGGDEVAGAAFTGNNNSKNGDGEEDAQQFGIAADDTAMEADTLDNDTIDAVLHQSFDFEDGDVNNRNKNDNKGGEVLGYHRSCVMS